MKRLRIAQQIIIVVLFAVIVPLVTTGLIISNISQQSVRRELNYSVTQISRYIADSIQRYIVNSDEEFSYIAAAINNLPQEKLKQKYLKDIENKSKKYSKLKIISKDSAFEEDFSYIHSRKTVQLYAPIDNNKVLSGELRLIGLDRAINDKSTSFMQSIFIFDNDNVLVAANNYNKEDIVFIVKALPKEKVADKGVLFSRIKNQPLAYYELKHPNWTVVVMTNPSVTRNTIDRARGKIILSLLIAAISIFLIVGFYTYYLYINIRQLFKGITAISKGSYDRKIRLLKSIFTPHEVAFLEKEFNYMTGKVSQAYSEISEKNIELKQLNEYRDSLVSAISHEFRTPLTSIIGYANRLLRKDIVLDENMKQKSLHIIKEQAQRLSRMVDDLLIVPDIESFHLSIDPKSVNLAKIAELCCEYSKKSTVVFKIDCEDNLKPVYADYDRLIQIIVNLCDNAAKYNSGENPIQIKMSNTTEGVEFRITNDSEEIPSDMLDKLYEKFIRLDSDLTRTTRGTGLGLYIVKGLCEVMNIKIKLLYQNSKFSVVLNFYDRKNDEQS